MKRILFVVVLMLVFISSTVSVYAAVAGGTEIDLQYIGTSSCVADIEKGLNRDVSFSGYLYPHEKGTFDTVVITLRVKNFASGSAVYDETFVTSYGILEGGFVSSDDCTVPTVGSYYLDVTFKCYKAGTLIETITLKSKMVTV